MYLKVYYFIDNILYACMQINKLYVFIMFTHTYIFHVVRGIQSVKLL